MNTERILEAYLKRERACVMLGIRQATVNRKFQQLLRLEGRLQCLNETLVYLRSYGRPAPLPELEQIDE